MQDGSLLQSRLDALLKENRIVLFMKGSASFPVCGFSSGARFMLKKCRLEFLAVNLLTDPGLHLYLREKFAPISAPYLYVDGRFIGGFDKVVELYNSGKLQNILSRF